MDTFIHCLEEDSEWTSPYIDIAEGDIGKALEVYQSELKRERLQQLRHTPDLADHFASEIKDVELMISWWNENPETFFSRCQESDNEHIFETGKVLHSGNFDELIF